METKLKRIYILSVEEPGDYIFAPAGVVIVMENGQFKVYCVSSSHNLFRAALYRHEWSSLEQGVVFRETSFRLEDKTEAMQHRGWTDTASIPSVLEYLYHENPKHLFFLQRHVE